MDNRPINKYEVVVRVSNPNKIDEISRIEFAYSVLDAVQQALFHLSGENPGLAYTIVRVGPPVASIFGNSPDGAISSEDLISRLKYNLRVLKEQELEAAAAEAEAEVEDISEVEDLSDESL